MRTKPGRAKVLCRRFCADGLKGWDRQRQMSWLLRFRFLSTKSNRRWFDWKAKVLQCRGSSHRDVSEARPPGRAWKTPELMPANHTQGGVRSRQSGVRGDY